MTYYLVTHFHLMQQGGHSLLITAHAVIKLVNQALIDFLQKLITQPRQINGADLTKFLIKGKLEPQAAMQFLMESKIIKRIPETSKILNSTELCTPPSVSEVFSEILQDYGIYRKNYAAPAGLPQPEENPNLWIQRNDGSDKETLVYEGHQHRGIPAYRQ